MALVKDRNPNIHGHQPHKFAGISTGEFEISEKSPEKNGLFAGNSSNSSSISSPNSATNSRGFVYHQQTEEGNSSVISFKPGHYNDNGFMGVNASSCFLNFEENDEQPYSNLNLGSNSFDNLRLLENLNCIQSGSFKDDHDLDLDLDHDQELESFGWPNHPSSGRHIQESCFHKRAHSGESEQVFKKQCTTNAATKKTKQKSTQAKDPQSIAAKNRRERISERLKVLQDLVPNGSKVDLVTMLEKAISYVKFLQLQVKVLAADEFWPVQGGKPPELSQVKDAIDAILSSSQRDRNSSSK